MKNTIIIFSLIILSSCRMGDFTLLSTKNVDNSKTKDYVLLKSNVTAKAFHLKTAVDKCIEKTEGGVVLQNVVLYEGFFRYKVKGDVWGIKKN